MTESKKGDDPDDIGKLPMYLGPYEAWNFGQGLGYTLRMMRKYTKYISALAELRDVLPQQSRSAPPTNAWLPTLWGNGSGLSFIPFVVAKPFGFNPAQLSGLLEAGFNVIAQQLPAFNYSATLQSSGYPKALGGIAASRFRVAFPIPDNAMHEDVRPQPLDPKWKPDGDLCDRIGQNKKITVIAIIDDGLPFAHRNFRDASGKRTRVEFCWLQAVEIDKNQKSVLFGREYTRHQIDHYIEQYGDDEDTLYREAGATADTEELGSLIDRHATHGAHVMDLATGYAAERHEVPPEEIRIIAVQLPNTIAWDTSGFGKDMYMLSAFHYIFDRADRIAKAYDVPSLRLVINFSYGFSGGRHDGEIELEAAINEMIERRRTRQDDFFCPSPTALVLPAGNTFVDRLHGLLRHKDFDDGTAKFYWRIQPNDRTTSYLELWFWYGFNPNGYEIELLDPWGKSISTFPIKADPPNLQNPGPDPGSMNPISIGTEKIGQISADLHRAGGAKRQYADRGRWRVLIALAPTEPENPALPRAEAGKWTVVVKRGTGQPLADDPIHCWIQRSADPESLRSGSRQSYFDDFKDDRFTLEGDFAEQDTDGAFVQRFGSLNGLATGGTSLVVAGYRLGAGLGSSLARAQPARYSSAGTLKPDWIDKTVDCSSMSDRSRALPGTIAAGVRSGSLSLIQGTSTAAPFVARQLATVFVTADDDRVAAAAGKNYLPLLTGEPSGNNDVRKARLGTVLVPPHRQPGVDVDLLV
jgi:hypothetical protein